MGDPAGNEIPNVSAAAKAEEGRKSKLWAEEARANIAFLSAKLEVITARHTASDLKADRSEASLRPGTPGRGPEDGHIGRRSRSQEEIGAICRSVRILLERAQHAATGIDPPYCRTAEWWSGTCADAAFKHIHYAEAALARLYDDNEVKSSVLDAVRRARSALAHSDPTRAAALNHLLQARAEPRPCTPEELSELIALGHEAADRQRAKLRKFRNIIVISMIVATVLTASFVALTAYNPSLVPLCFIHDPAAKEPFTTPFIVCPSGEGRVPKEPSGGDVFVVAILGLLGGLLSAAFSVRSLHTNSTPYNVAIPLAALKLPAGALTAVGGMIMLAGDFVPGFSAVDKQNQILAYALVFGFAQQLLTKMLDERAEQLVASIPTKVAATDANRTPQAEEFTTVVGVPAPSGNGSHRAAATGSGSPDTQRQ